MYINPTSNDEITDADPYARFYVRGCADTLLPTKPDATATGYVKKFTFDKSHNNLEKSPLRPNKA